MCGNEIPKDEFECTIESLNVPQVPMPPPGDMSWEARATRSMNSHVDYTASQNFVGYRLCDQFTASQLKILNDILELKINQILDEKKASEEAELDLEKIEYLANVDWISKQVPKNYISTVKKSLKERLKDWCCF